MPTNTVDHLGTVGLALAALATFYLGILPTRLINLATQSISTIS